MKATIQIKEINITDIYNEGLDIGFYDNKFDDQLYVVDSMKNVWGLGNSSNYGFMTNQQIREPKETKPSISESFALKMVAVAMGNVDKLKL